MTAGALRTLMVIAVCDNGEGLSYEDVAHETDQDYIQALHHIELLSTGRRNQNGPELLIRSRTENSRVKRVMLSEKGANALRVFALSARRHPDFARVSEELGQGPLQAIDEVVKYLPGISLGTLTVFLNVGLMQREFGFDGLPANKLAKKLHISNLPRHLAILGAGLKKRDGQKKREKPEKRTGYDVIRLVVSEDDGRVKLPEVTGKGHEVLTAIASAVMGENAHSPKRAKATALTALESPDDIDNLDDVDFETLFKKE